MRSNYPMNGTKPEGFIVRRSQQKILMAQQRTLSMEHPVPKSGALDTHEVMQKRTSIGKEERDSPEMVDEQVYYNADFCSPVPKSKNTVTYEDAESTIFPASLKDSQLGVAPVTYNSRLTRQL